MDPELRLHCGKDKEEKKEWSLIRARVMTAAQTEMPMLDHAPERKPVRPGQ